MPHKWTYQTFIWYVFIVQLTRKEQANFSYLKCCWSPGWDVVGLWIETLFFERRIVRVGVTMWWNTWACVICLRMQWDVFHLERRWCDYETKPCACIHLAKSQRMRCSSSGVSYFHLRRRAGILASDISPDYKLMELWQNMFLIDTLKWKLIIIVVSQLQRWRIRDAGLSLFALRFLMGWHLHAPNTWFRMRVTLTYPPTLLMLKFLSLSFITEDAVLVNCCLKWRSEVKQCSRRDVD